MSTGWVVVAVVMMAVMMGGMLWMMGGMGSRREDAATSDPLEILRQRLARGEISEEEYTRVRRALEERGGS